MTTNLDILLDIADAAAEVVREVYETPFSVDFKGPKDPVTAADRRANTLICARLAEAFPGVPIVAEESDPESFAGFRSSDRVFFVDPLDGTAEFIDRNGQFVVMIGMIEGDRATTGVVCAPAQEIAWAASPETGAFRVARGGARTPIRVTETATLAASRAVASRSHRAPSLEKLIELMGCREVVALGSAGLKGAEIARGAAEVYVGPGNVGKRWDACAVDAIVTAAGGRFTDAFGLLYDYRHSSIVNDRGLLATNGLVHDAVLSCLERLRAG